MFYQHARRELSQRLNVTWLRGKVDALETAGEAARAIVNHVDRDRTLGLRQ